VIDVLINRARSFIYSTAPPPHLVHATLEMLRLVQMDQGDQLRSRLSSNVACLMERLRTAKTDLVRSCPAAAIFPVMVGDEQTAVRLSGQLLEAGFLVPAIRFPTVARGGARLRLCMSALHNSDKIFDALDIMLSIVKPRF
jgi:7-keto-8-aminopelargonate synthetase-like enzyme